MDWTASFERTSPRLPSALVMGAGFGDPDVVETTVQTLTADAVPANEAKTPTADAVSANEVQNPTIDAVTPKEDLETPHEEPATAMAAPLSPAHDVCLVEVKVLNTTTKGIPKPICVGHLSFSFRNGKSKGWALPGRSILPSGHDTVALFPLKQGERIVRILTLSSIIRVSKPFFAHPTGFFAKAAVNVAMQFHLNTGRTSPWYGGCSPGEIYEFNASEADPIVSFYMIHGSRIRYADSISNRKKWPHGVAFEGRSSRFPQSCVKPREIPQSLGYRPPSWAAWIAPHFIPPELRHGKQDLPAEYRSGEGLPASFFVSYDVRLEADKSVEEKQQREHQALTEARLVNGREGKSWRHELPEGMWLCDMLCPRQQPSSNTYSGLGPGSLGTEPTQEGA